MPKSKETKFHQDTIHDIERRKAKVASGFSGNSRNAPVISEGRKQWVDFGVNNLYPLEIMELEEQSSVHNTLIEKIAEFIAGEGFIIEGKDEK